MPEDSVNLWTWSTFSFVEPIFKVATSRTLNEEDVWSLSPYFKHKNLFTKYLKYKEEWERSTVCSVQFVDCCVKAPNAFALVVPACIQLPRSHHRPDS